MADGIVLTHEGFKALKTLGEMEHKACSGAKKGFSFAGHFLIKKSKSGMKQPKTGRFYIFKGKRIRASAPGEYPARRSRDLFRSLGFQIISSEDMDFGSRLDAKYPRILEKGSEGGKITRRSYLERPVEENKTKIANIIGKEIEKELKRK